MNIAPARLTPTAPACGQFGERCEHARTHGLSPDPQDFVAQFIMSGTHAPRMSGDENPRKSLDGDRRVA